MIFAAGLGTRLKPLTDNCPKALIPVGGKPMLQIVIEQLKKYGFNEIILNVHYLAEQIYDFVEQNNQFGIKISFSDETDKLLETGGGLRYLLFDDEDILFGWENVKTHEVKIPRKISNLKSQISNPDYQHPLHERAFSGYHIISPEIFKTCKRDGIFSMVDWYLDICNDHTITCFHHNDDIWIDIGSPEQLEKANEVIQLQQF